MATPAPIALDQLPTELPVFPLAGAIVLPRWHLPLNIFEPRYLNMFDDAMTGPRLIGMIQSVGGDRAKPDLAKIGCVGQISQFTETDDGRYGVLLTGLIRYRIVEELSLQKPYRMVKPDYLPFAKDLTRTPAPAFPTKTMITDMLRPYAETHGLSVDWDAAKEGDLETLVSALATSCPFETMEKQALLEAADLSARAETLIQILQFNTSTNSGRTQRPQ